MQLTTHTDYALRTLLVLGVAAPEKLRTRDIGDAFDVSEHHLLKVVQTLSRHGFVETTRGKDGGICLGRTADRINIGNVIRLVEGELGVVPCLKKDGIECYITPVCGLKGLFADATEAFLAHLDNYSLADLLSEEMGRGGKALRRRLVKKIPHLAQIGLAAP